MLNIGSGGVAIPITMQAGSVPAAIDKVVNSLSGLVKKIGKVNTALGIVAAVGFYKFAKELNAGQKEAIAFQKEVAELTKLLGPQVAKPLAEAVADLSEVMPLAREELSDIAATAARLGVRGTKNILDFTKAMAKMGVATNISATEAADAMARIAKQTQLPIGKIENLGSVINELANNMATSSSEIVESMRRSAPELARFGLSADQIAALSASLNTVSESASRAGTRLRRLAQSMTDPTKVEIFAEAIGKTRGEFEELRQTDPVGLITELVRVYEKGGARADTLASKLDARARLALAALSQIGGDLAEAFRMAGYEMENNMSLMKEYERFLGIIPSKQQLIHNQIRENRREIGERTLPVVAKWQSLYLSVLRTINEILETPLEGVLPEDEVERTERWARALAEAVQNQRLMDEGAGGLGIFEFAPKKAVTGPEGAAENFKAYMKDLEDALGTVPEYGEQFKELYDLLGEQYVVDINNGDLEATEEVAQRLRIKVVGLQGAFVQLSGAIEGMSIANKAAIGERLTAIIDQAKSGAISAEEAWGRVQTAVLDFGGHGYQAIKDMIDELENIDRSMQFAWTSEMWEELNKLEDLLESQGLTAWEAALKQSEGYRHAIAEVERLTHVIDQQKEAMEAIDPNSDGAQERIANIQKEIDEREKQIASLKKWLTEVGLISGEIAKAAAAADSASESVEKLTNYYEGLFGIINLVNKMMPQVKAAFDEQQALEGFWDDLGLVSQQDKIARTYQQMLAFIDDLRFQTEETKQELREYANAWRLAELATASATEETDEAAKALERLQNKFDLATIQGRMRLFERLVVGMSDATIDFFDSIIEGSEKAGEAFINMIRDIAKELFRYNLMEFFFKLGIGMVTAGGGGVGGGAGAALSAPSGPTVISKGSEFIGDLGPGLAEGGPLPAKRITLVGEEGPELFVPDDDVPQENERFTRIKFTDRGAVETSNFEIDRSEEDQVTRVVSGKGKVVGKDGIIVGENGPEFIYSEVPGEVINAEQTPAAVQAKEMVEPSVEETVVNQEMRVESAPEFVPVPKEERVDIDAGTVEVVTEQQDAEPERVTLSIDTQADVPDIPAVEVDTFTPDIDVPAPDLEVGTVQPEPVSVTAEVPTVEVDRPEEQPIDVVTSTGTVEIAAPDAEVPDIVVPETEDIEAASPQVLMPAGEDISIDIVEPEILSPEVSEVEVVAPEVSVGDTPAVEVAPEYEEIVLDEVAAPEVAAQVATVEPIEIKTTGAEDVSVAAPPIEVETQDVAAPEIVVGDVEDISVDVREPETQEVFVDDIQVSAPEIVQDSVDQVISVPGTDIEVPDMETLKEEISIAAPEVVSDIEESGTVSITAPPVDVDVGETAVDIARQDGVRQVEIDAQPVEVPTAPEPPSVDVSAVEVEDIVVPEAELPDIDVPSTEIGQPEVVVEAVDIEPTAIPAMEVGGAEIDVPEAGEQEPVSIVVPQEPPQIDVETPRTVYEGVGMPETEIVAPEQTEAVEIDVPAVESTAPVVDVAEPTVEPMVRVTGTAIEVNPDVDLVQPEPVVLKQTIGDSGRVRGRTVRQPEVRREIEIEAPEVETPQQQRIKGKVVPREFFPTMMATGGKIDAEQIAIVGERGPELFVPDVGGTIVPNNKVNSVGGGDDITVNVNNNFTIQAMDSADVKRVLAREKEFISGLTLSSIDRSRMIKKGGMRGA